MKREVNVFGLLQDLPVDARLAHALRPGQKGPESLTPPLQGTSGSGQVGEEDAASVYGYTDTL
jgi:hypothetical protein